MSLKLLAIYGTGLATVAISALLLFVFKINPRIAIIAPFILGAALMIFIGVKLSDDLVFPRKESSGKKGK